MHIPSYQIQNVLNVFSQQLSQKANADGQSTPDERLAPEIMTISAEGKRRTIIEQVVADIIDRITRSGSHDVVEEGTLARRTAELLEPTEAPKNHVDARFVFSVIAKNNTKLIKSVPIEDGGFLMKRLENVADEMVDINLGPASGESL